MPRSSRPRLGVFNLTEPKSGWFRFVNKTDDENAVDVYIQDEIGGWGVYASDFVRELHAQTANTINVHINSPGGDVFEGIAIHNALASYPATVNTYVDGLAASAASFIAQAGATRTMGKYAQMMIHDPSGGVWGRAKEMRRMADLLDKIRDTIIGMYADRSGDSKIDWAGMMDAETWMTAEEAVEFGLADGIDTNISNQGTSAENRSRWDLKAAYEYAGREEAPAPVRRERIVTNKAPEPARLDNPTVNAGGPQDAPESVPAPILAIDSDLMKRALEFGIAPPTPADVAAEDAARAEFDQAWNADLMHTALKAGIDDVVYQPAPEPEPAPVTFESAYDPDLFRRSVLEGIRK